MTELLTRAAQFTPSSYDGERHTVDAVFSTGAEVARYDFEGPLPRAALDVARSGQPDRLRQWAIARFS
jgi:hypothetical protein